MPPRLPPIGAGLIKNWRLGSRQPYSSSCSTCALVALVGYNPARKKRVQSSFQTRSAARQQSNPAVKTSIGQGDSLRNPIDDISKLRSTLSDLQKRFRRYVNLSRLHLALRGLEQQPGEETIRVAILGLTDQERTSANIRELVRLFLADPLKEEEEWEGRLTADQYNGRPLLLRIGEDNHDSANSGISNRLIQELSISSPSLNAHRLEILVMETDNFYDTTEARDKFADTILVPNVEIPVSSTGKYTPVTTPVHKALVVGDGILGAAALTKLPAHDDSEAIMSAVDLPGYVQDDRHRLPFHVIDITLAKAALASFRESLDNAISYEHDWFKSGIPELLQWLKAGTLDAPGGPVKPPVCALILSLLADASRRIEYEESRQLSALLSSKVSSSALNSLRDDLESWAQRAHTELRDQLDIAFEGGRWRKLGWWKLFWRVDDVSMIASDIINQRFLTESEKEIIYLAGKIEEAGVLKALPAIQPTNWAYKPVPEIQAPPALGSTPPPLSLQDVLDRPQDDISVSVKPQPWPLQIPIARSYLSMDTVPALQALAQRLIVQTLTTSSFASAFAGLLYVSTFTSGLYEAGAVAAFGIVWSLRRMQKEWETARKFWEGEVREEGRKAVRAVEGVVKEVLAGPAKSTIEGAEELEKARKAVAEAREALERATTGHAN